MRAITSRSYRLAAAGIALLSLSLNYQPATFAEEAKTEASESEQAEPNQATAGEDDEKYSDTKGFNSFKKRSSSSLLKRRSNPTSRSSRYSRSSSSSTRRTPTLLKTRTGRPVLKKVKRPVRKRPVVSSPVVTTPGAPSSSGNSILPGSVPADIGSRVARIDRNMSYLRREVDKLSRRVGRLENVVRNSNTDSDGPNVAAQLDGVNLRLRKVIQVLGGDLVIDRVVDDNRIRYRFVEPDDNEVSVQR